MSSFRWPLASLAILALSVLSRAQDLDVLDQYIQTEMERQHIPGLSLAIAKYGSLLTAKSYGFANLEHKVPVHNGTVFKIGSISKPILATAIMKLVEMGKLDVEAEVRSYLTELPEAWAGIRVKHLLSHTSGLAREITGWTGEKDFTAEQLLEMIAKETPVTKPGSKYSYSNCGYFTLALLASKVGGKPWPELVQELVFAPANMEHSTTTDWRPVVTHRASGYEWRNGQFENDGFIRSIRPSGAFLSTSQDLLDFVYALNSGKIVRSDTLKQMQTPFTLSDGTLSPYGFGWTIEHFRGRRTVGHNGAILGFRSGLLHSEQDSSTIVVLTNSASADPNNIAKGVMRWLVPETSMATWTPRPGGRKETMDETWEGLKNVGDGKPFGGAAAPAFAESLGSMPTEFKDRIKDRVSKSTGLQHLRTETPLAPISRFEVPVQTISYYRMAGLEPPIFVTVYLSKDHKFVSLEMTLH